MSAAPKRGAIRSLAAYAQGKMLDHSAWSGVLPRNITPSDIDMCLDNDGNILYCELSRNADGWIGPDGKTHSRIGYGQMLLYFNAIGPISKNLSVLLHHSVPTDRAINTLADIECFQVMVRNGDERLFCPKWHDWQKFVTSWFTDADATRRICVQAAAKAAPSVANCDEWLADYERSYEQNYGERPW